jgi:death on curing protein
LNQATVKEHGGNFVPPYNFLYEENLDYLLEAVMAEMFGVPLYPTITDKAALYCHNRYFMILLAKFNLTPPSPFWRGL